jgi:protein-S-isoprenylcysteine O-methyltransferase Ste14
VKNGVAHGAVSKGTYTDPTALLMGTWGKGTLAPWEPTQRLVVRGVYRHVRNPMISGFLFVLLGESLFTASLPLFWWFLFVAFVNVTDIPTFGRAWSRETI